MNQQVWYFIGAVAVLFLLYTLVRNSGGASCGSMMMTHGGHAGHAGHAGVHAGKPVHLTGSQPGAHPLDLQCPSAPQGSVPFNAQASHDAAMRQRRRQYISNGQCEELFRMGYPQDGVVCADLTRYGFYPKVHTLGPN